MIDNGTEEPRERNKSGVRQGSGLRTGLSVGMLNDLRDELFKNRRLFRLNDEAITRILVERFYDENAWQLSLEQIREALIDLHGESDDIPEDPAQVSEWVRKDLFGLKCLPKEKLLERYIWASEDLAVIELNIADCEKVIEKLESKTSRTEQELSKLRICKHYLGMNREAKHEIVRVLTDEIYSNSLMASWNINSMMVGLASNFPWSFRARPDRFHYSSFSPVRHAFMKLSVRELAFVTSLYILEDKTEFDHYLANFLANEKPSKKIRELVTEHHLLNDRKNVIFPALEAYERGLFELFISAVATQIEGLIGDGCILGGISHEKVKSQGMIDKLKDLLKINPGCVDYVYYAYEFPKLRNKIAHGHMIKEDVKRNAHLLLLDLEDCCKMVRDHSCVSNTLTNFLRAKHPDKGSVADVIEFAFIAAENNFQPPDEFYRLTENFEKFDCLVNSPVVWNFLTNLVDANGMDTSTGLRFLGINYKKRTKAIQKTCTSLLKKLNGRGEKKHDRKIFIWQVSQQPGNEALVNN